MANTDRTLEIRIVCGERTCATEPGKFCEHIGALYFGTFHVCRLFPGDAGPWTALEDRDGWLQRCDACLAAEHRDGSKQ